MSNPRPRLNYRKLAPALFQAQIDLSNASANSGLEHSLLHLVRLRASQINGCAYCVDLHTHEARAEGETEQRLYLVAVWRESRAFTERERVALAWTEAVTLISQGGVSDALYDEARAQFSDEELVKLTTAVNVINSWNRLAVAFHSLHPDRSKGAANPA